MTTELIANPRSSTLAPATVRTMARHILAVTAIIAIHFVLWASAMATYSIAEASGFTFVLPKQPPLVIWIAALVLTHCSSIAIWWARFPWPYHVKTVIAFLACGCLWALLATTLTVCHYHPISAACWAAAIATQLVLTGVSALVLDSVVFRPRSAKWPQFSIMYLLLWTAVAASLLGAARWLSESWGWTVEEILGWEYTRHLQILAVVDCLLAIGLIVGVRLKSSWYVRSIVCALMIFLFCVFGSLFLFEPQRGPTYSDLVWLLGNQGLFLVATLIPLELAREART